MAGFGGSPLTLAPPGAEELQVADAIRISLRHMEEKVNQRLDQTQSETFSRLDRLERSLADLVGHCHNLSEAVQGQIRSGEQMERRLVDWRGRTEAELVAWREASCAAVTAASSSALSPRPPALEAGAWEEAVRHQSSRVEALEAAVVLATEASAAVDQRREEWKRSTTETDVALDSLRQQFAHLSDKVQRLSQDSNTQRERMEAQEQRVRMIRTLVDAQEECVAESASSRLMGSRRSSINSTCHGTPRGTSAAALIVQNKKKMLSFGGVSGDEDRQAEHYGQGFDQAEEYVTDMNAAGTESPDCEAVAKSATTNGMSSASLGAQSVRLEREFIGADDGGQSSHSLLLRVGACEAAIDAINPRLESLSDSVAQAVDAVDEAKLLREVDERRLSSALSKQMAAIDIALTSLEEHVGMQSKDLLLRPRSDDVPSSCSSSDSDLSES